MLSRRNWDKQQQQQLTFSLNRHLVLLRGGSGRSPRWGGTPWLSGFHGNHPWGSIDNSWGLSYRTVQMLSSSFMALFLTLCLTSLICFIIFGTFTVSINQSINTEILLWICLGICFCSSHIIFLFRMKILMMFFFFKNKSRLSSLSKISFQ